MGVAELYGGFRALAVAAGLSVALWPLSDAIAQDLRGPTLAAASNFGQGWRPDIFNTAQELPVQDFRDAVYWDDTDPGDGTFQYLTDNTVFPDLMADEAMGMSLTVNNGHPAYDAGVTPYTEAGIAGFAAHAAAMVERFPAIHTVEVGNEVNADNFVSGPVRDVGLSGRAAMYLQLLRAVHGAVKAVRPEVAILGGGVHSIPVGYLDDLMALGAADYMDALAFHPYTTPAEQILRQVEILRQLPGLETMPLEVTEFGSEDPVEAPGHLIRSYCQMALAGVTRVVWYALNDRGDGLVPLIDSEGRVTAVGRAYRLAERLFEGKTVTAIRPDPFTYGCIFGGTTAVVWGMPRKLTPAEDLEVFTANGTALDPAGLELSETEPLILTGLRQITEADLRFGDQRVLADSYHQFAYPDEREARAPGDGFERFAMGPAGEIPLITMPGQERDGTLWTPYRADSGNHLLRVTAEQLIPSGDADAPTRIIHRYTVPETSLIGLETTWDVPERSADGIDVTIRLDDQVLARTVMAGQSEITLPLVQVIEGQVLTVSVGPNLTPAGDVVAYRITLRKP